MPAVSRKQRKAAGMALAAKRGEISPEELVGAARQMYESMTEEQLRDFAKTKEKNLPPTKEKRRTKKRSKFKVLYRD